MDPRPIAELTAVLRGVAVVNVCERNVIRNVGDHWSAIGRTVGWVNELGVVISLREAQSLYRPGRRSPLQGKLVIVGGSGLIGPVPFEEAIEAIFPQYPMAVVIWGVGHNVVRGLTYDRRLGYRNRLLMDGTTLLWPEYFAWCRLVGVRDYGTGLPWAPCASCMLPAFDSLRAIAPVNEFSVVNHYALPIDTSAARGRRLRFRHTTNATEDVLAVLRTIVSGRVVVTSSYHAAYWALLLGRGAVVVGVSDSRFRHLRWPVVQASQWDWLDAVAAAPRSPSALAEAREATVGFSARVLDLACSLGLVDSGLEVDPGRPVRPRPL